MYRIPFRGLPVRARATTPTFSPKSRFVVFGRILLISLTQGRPRVACTRRNTQQQPNTVASSGDSGLGTAATETNVWLSVYDSDTHTHTDNAVPATAPYCIRDTLYHSASGIAASYCEARSDAPQDQVERRSDERSADNGGKAMERRSRRLLPGPFSGIMSCKSLPEMSESEPTLPRS